MGVPRPLCELTSFGAREKVQFAALAVAAAIAFTKLIEARALKVSKDLLDQAKNDIGDEPVRIDFYHPARPSADAADILRDLKNPKMALAWNQYAAAMPTGGFTRSVGDQWRNEVGVPRTRIDAAQQLTVVLRLWIAKEVELLFL
ncbi:MULTISPECIES: hypothetical protein [unclassified Streptomyces]|uniref:hypothetical protein n=1 Tax=unclassified Streptomyces TaxID=2593676 RepID=UPI0026A2C312